MLRKHMEGVDRRRGEGGPSPGLTTLLPPCGGGTHLAGSESIICVVLWRSHPPSRAFLTLEKGPDKAMLTGFSTA